MNNCGLTASSLRVLEVLHVDVQGEIVLRGGIRAKSLKEAGSFSKEDKNRVPSQVPTKQASSGGKGILG